MILAVTSIEEPVRLGYQKIIKLLILVEKEPKQKKRVQTFRIVATLLQC